MLCSNIGSNITPSLISQGGGGVEDPLPLVAAIESDRHAMNISQKYIMLNVAYGCDAKLTIASIILVRLCHVIDFV